ncbi:MAG: helix-turn-helix domain-containing protein [Fusobacteriaceae bacterium]
MEQFKHDLIQFIKAKIQGYTQVDAAKILGVTQPRISNLQNNKTELFSIDMLLNMIHKLGYECNMNLCAGGFTVTARKIKVKKSISVIA